MKIDISIEIVGDRVVASCSPFGLTVDGEYLMAVIDELREVLPRQIYFAVEAGQYKADDPCVVRLIGGDFEDATFEFEQIEHDIYMERIKSLMAKHYPSLLDEVMWHMLVPRHRLEWCDEGKYPDQYQARIEADKQEKAAYDDLEVNGPSGTKWQVFLSEYMADPYQSNKHFLIKHGLVVA